MTNTIKKTIPLEHSFGDIVKPIGDTHIVSARSHGTSIEVIDLSTGKDVCTLFANHYLSDLAVLSDDRIAFVETGQSATYVMIWHYKKHKKAKLLHKRSSRSDNLFQFFDKTGKEYVGIYSDSFNILIVGLDTGEVVAQIKGDYNKNHFFLNVTQLDNGSLIWLAYEPGYGTSNKLHFYHRDISSGEVVINKEVVSKEGWIGGDVSEVRKTTVTSFSYLHHNRYAVGYFNGAVRVWDIGSEKFPIYFDANNDNKPVRKIIAISDTLFATESDKRWSIWDIQSLTLVEQLEGDYSELVSVKENRLAASRCLNLAGLEKDFSTELEFINEVLEF